MFSTVESSYSRFVEIRIIANDEQIRIECPPKYSADVQRIRAFPTTERITRLAQDMLDEEWIDYGSVSIVGQRSSEFLWYDQTGISTVFDNDKIVSNADGQSENRRTIRRISINDASTNNSVIDTLDVRGIRLIVWKLEFDGEDATIWARSIESVIVGSDERSN